MRKMLKLFVLSMVLVLVAAVHSTAQVTTSGMQGRITDTNSAPLPGATIVAVHEPSGSQYATIANAEGMFNLQGMRPGGPYNVKVSFVGYGSISYTDITLYLGQSFILNSQLSESVTEVAEVMVVGAKPSAFGTEKTGAATNIGSRQMDLMPTMNRNLGDYTKLSPYSTGSGSYAGREAYMTNVTVDGANFNNNFGLSGSNMPGVSGEPISMDAIEEIQIAIAPYDVRQSNFTGAGVNAVTKSGTNQFKGSAYTYFRNQNFNGKKIRDNELTVSDMSKNIYGLTLGGPIIKNKLFFFVSGEMEKSLTPGNTLLAWQEGRDPKDPNVNSRVSAADLQRFSNLLKSKYGYDTGAYENWGGDNESNNKLLAKIDWNINPDHKLSVRYNFSSSSAIFRPSNSGDARPSISGGRHSQTGGISFENSQYYNSNTLHSLTAELNSRFGNIPNKFLVAYTKYGQPRKSDSSLFPFIDIMSGDATKGDVMMSAGYELFSYKNNMDNNTLIITDNLTYLMDKHTFTAGVSYEYQTFANSYLRQGSGYYRFKDLNSFERYVNGDGAGQAFNADYHPINFGYTYPINGLTNPESTLSFGQFATYIQDEWSGIENLKITAGLRIDVPMYFDGAVDNPNLANYSFRDGEKVDLSSWPESRILWSPRLGFNWNVLGDNTLKVRGGTGIFTGRVPFVWFTNQPSNSGMIQYQQVINMSGGAADQAKLARIPFAADVSQLLKDNTLTDIFPQSNPVGGRIAAIDKNFKLPQVWRSSIGVDIQLPLDMQLTVEGVYTKDINSIMFDNINIKDAESTIKEGTNERPYWSNSTTATKYITAPYTDVVIMRNTKEGQGYSFSAQLDLPKFAGFNGMIAYSTTWGEEVSGKNGSDPFSAWQYRQIQNTLNTEELGLTLNNTPHRVVAALNYSVEYAKFFGTTISLMYTGYKGGAYSFIYNGDANKDGTSSHELVYIPRTQDELLWDTQADADAYFEFAKQDPYLSKHAGEYMVRNAAYLPWNSSLDLRLLQDIKIKAGNSSNKLQLSVDIMNFANLLNSSWGLNQIRVTNTPLQVVGRDAATGMLKVRMQKIGGEYVKSSFQDPTTVAGTWGMQLGIRYIFN